MYIMINLFIRYSCNMSLSVQANVVSGRRTRKAQKRNKFVLMLNGFMLRDCAHIRRFERQLSRQVGCNYRLNQFSVCERERACVICPPFTL